jgi:hypothetical protein
LREVVDSFSAFEEWQLYAALKMLRRVRSRLLTAARPAEFADEVKLYIVASERLMPCRYTIDIPKALIISTAWDRVTYTEIKRHHDDMVNDPDFDRNFKQLLDFTGVSSLQLSKEGAKKIAVNSCLHRRGVPVWLVIFRFLALHASCKFTPKWKDETPSPYFTTGQRH